MALFLIGCIHLPVAARPDLLLEQEGRTCAAPGHERILIFMPLRLETVYYTREEIYAWPWTILSFRHPSNLHILRHYIIRNMLRYSLIVLSLSSLSLSFTATQCLLSEFPTRCAEFSTCQPTTTCGGLCFTVTSPPAETPCTLGQANNPCKKSYVCTPTESCPSPTTKPCRGACLYVDFRKLLLLCCQLIRPSLSPSAYLHAPYLTCSKLHWLPNYDRSTSHKALQNPWHRVRRPRAGRLLLPDPILWRRVRWDRPLHAAHANINV